jgi:hypothetical protein
MKNIFWNKEKEDVTWFGIAFIVIAVVSIISVAVYLGEKSSEESDKRQAEYEKTRIVFGDYVKLTKLSCGIIKKEFSKKLTKGLEDFDTNLMSCGETYSNFYLRRSLIRYKHQMMMVDWEWAYDNQDAKILKYNVPYCVIATDIAEFPVAEPCERIP